MESGKKIPCMDFSRWDATADNVKQEIVTLAESAKLKPNKYRKLASLANHYGVSHKCSCTLWRNKAFREGVQEYSRKITGND